MKTSVPRHVAARAIRCCGRSVTTGAQAAPCTIVILVRQRRPRQAKLLPAIYQLANYNCSPKDATSSGARGRKIGRRQIPRDDARRVSASDEKNLRFRLSRGGARWPREIHYGAAIWRCIGLRETGAAARADRVGTRAQDRIDCFNLAVRPSVFQPIVRALSRQRAAPRLRDSSDRPCIAVASLEAIRASLETARALSRLVLDLFDELSANRIDHIWQGDGPEHFLVFRFANAIFEPILTVSRSSTSDHAWPRPSAWKSAASTTRKQASFETCSRTTCFSC